MRHAARALRRSPVFTLSVALTLALGLGATTAMFAVAYGVLLAPLPYGHPDRLVALSLDGRRLPPGAYFTFARLARRLDGVGFYRTGNANLGADADERTAERVPATWVTASTVPTLQVRPLLGRAFTPDEDRVGGPDAVVIGERLWRARYGARPDVVGRTLVVNSVPRTIVGVMPAAFAFPSPATRVWLPARVDRDTGSVGDFAYDAVARLAPGAGPDDARRELALLLPRMAEWFPRMASGAATAGWLAEQRPAPVVVPLADAVTGGVARTLWLLLGAAGLVCLVALANVLNLVMIRADARRHELAVRAALGAGRARLAAHFLGEAALLSAAAGALGLLGAWAAVRLLRAHGPADVPRLDELRVGPAVLAYSSGTALLAAAVCGLVPALRLPRASLGALRDGGRGETAGRARRRVRDLVAATQVAAALVVLAGSALLLRSFQRLSAEPPGFDAADVTTVWTQLPFARYDDSAAVAFHARLASRVRELPGVRAAGVTAVLPLGGGERVPRSFAAEGAAEGEVSLPTVAIDDGYLATLRIPLLAGRGFLPSGAQPSGEVIVSRRAAARLWGDATGRAAVGRRLTANGLPYTVIGVAGDVRDDDLALAPAPTVYVPQAVPRDTRREPAARRGMALVVRSSLPPAAVLAAVRGVVRELDPAVPTYDERPMAAVLRASTARLSFTLALMGAAAAIAVVLAAVGLYGVIAYMVALRMRELGIRIALGAAPARVARMVAGRGLGLVAGGVAGGLLLFAGASRLLRSLLYGVSAGDPWALAAAAALLFAVGLLASWLPAWRASRVDPAVALRAE